MSKKSAGQKHPKEPFGDFMFGLNF